MRTKEFIKAVEALGHMVDTAYGEIFIKSTEGWNMCRVSKSVVGRMDTYIVNWNDDLDLLNLMAEYAKTPLDEREEPKLYYAKHKWLGSPHYNYLNLSGGIFSLSNNEEGAGYRTKFTQKELVDLGVWDSNEWDVEEVAENYTKVTDGLMNNRRRIKYDKSL